MRITILATATVFELTDTEGGQQTIFRNDLVPDDSPQWLDAVVDEAKGLIGGDWVRCPVTVVAADPDSAELLSDVLLADGAEVDREDLQPSVRGTDGAHTRHAGQLRGELTIRRPRSGSRHRAPFRPTFFHAAVVAVVLGVVAVSWWSLGDGGDGPEETTAPESSAVVSSTTLTEETHPRQESESPETPPETPSGSVVLDAGNISVTMPDGYILNPGATGDVMATGPDPDLRIHLAADPGLGLPPETILEEVAMRVATDPVLHRADRAGLRPAVEAVTYREDPGDGSFVDWITWVEEDHQLSVGCHTRTAPTVAQRAICRMAVNSVVLRKDAPPEKIQE
ncbi:type VII secretion-associated protein [Corynebacterium sp. CCM 9185]|uniref:Type VII secretion-associated protein n=1 Tax=Corynebacterium marambiense TaxID=2765364 RepID=A0ABS0VRP0_9CORY|nr:type VII secretion-associated protein [Corynebacterium marambiense]MBI8999445.1 type VII secretion-associated protein [Corynebacterium marambiense]MCK7662283.1 type VII secretion-associated protein [Corynebacterium marambiense]